MGILSLSSRTSRSLLDIFRYVIVLFCMIMMDASLATVAATSVLGGNETDQPALLAFKANIVDDPLQAMSSWNGTNHFCRWQGVTCSSRRQRVTRLDLRSMKLFGSISPHIGNLSFLRVLNLPNNSFYGAIPPEIGRLRRLQFLALHNNSLSGNIPVNLSACSNLIGLNLGGNTLVGSIPAELGSLPKLRILYIRHNILTGHIPHSFMNLSSLETLGAFGNRLDGSIPDALGHLTNLTFLSLGDNMLSGTIPPSIFNLSSLVLFEAGYNEGFMGSLPSDMGITLPNLRHFALPGNQLTGSIPASISNTSNLELLQIGNNKLTGDVPTMGRLYKLQVVSISINSLGSGDANDLGFLSSLTNATDLRTWVMDSNNFGGMLPESIGNLSTKLEMFAAAYNHIRGSIPAGIGNLIHLTVLNLWGNQLTGNIPYEIGRLQNLNNLDLSNNNLSGHIPTSLGNLSVLNRLNLANNNLSGSISPNLENCHNLLLLDLSKNQFSGAIPPQVFSLSSLSMYLDLSRNHFTGSLPAEVGKLNNVGALDVSDNMLSAEIPSSIGSCTRLEFLIMAGNFFHGSIPSALSSLRGLQVLDLSRNNLSGTIPEFFQTFKLFQSLNLSYNDFEGVIPSKGVFGNATAFSVIGNSKLCGGTLELKMPECRYKWSTKKKSTRILKLVIPTTLGLLGLALVMCSVFRCWRRNRKEKSSGFSSENSELFPRLSYGSLRTATDGFSESNLIGMGNYGSVYKGFLDEYGKMIAVKVLNLLHRGASKSFIAECEALRNIRHRNIVKVLSVCSSTDHQNNDFKALVYEFMLNGNLDAWLHPPTHGGEYEEPKSLSLVQRINIAIDVACALDYLHHHSQSPIVHCDLKPSNILLDNKMSARISDFGLAKFLDASFTNSADQASSLGIRGTIGYTPPEYGTGGEVSTLGDVYSYGILLLEMFAGKRPTDEMFYDGMKLHDHVKKGLAESVVAIADPTLFRQIEEGEIRIGTHTAHQSHADSPKVEECLTSIFEIGIQCSAESPSRRLNITDAVAKLHVIKKHLISTDGNHGERRITDGVQPRAGLIPPLSP